MKDAVFVGTLQGSSHAGLVSGPLAPDINGRLLLPSSRSFLVRPFHSYRNPTCDPITHRLHSSSFWGLP